MTYAWRLISDFHFVWNCCMNHVFILSVHSHVYDWLQPGTDVGVSGRHLTDMRLLFYLHYNLFLLHGDGFSCPLSPLHDTEQCRIVASQWRKFVRAPKWKIPRPLSVYSLYSFPQLRLRITLKAIFFLCRGNVKCIYKFCRKSEGKNTWKSCA